jgi:molecular chaperone DnaJ
MAGKDYYKILGVDRKASQEEIKKAFRQMARKHHPDIAGKEGEEKFKEINEAFQVLGNPQSRKQYDRHGVSDFDTSGFSQGQAEDFGDIFSGFGFDDIFNIFSGGSQERQASNAGSDLRFDMDITLEEAFSGIEKEIEYPADLSCESCNGTGAKNSKLETCPECNGAGRVRKAQRTPFGQFVSVVTCSNCQGLGKIAQELCPKCKGQGRIRKKRKLKIKIPAGVEHNSYLRIAGQGEGGILGGPPGDLYVLVRIKPHPSFEREGNDLHHEEKISLLDAILGRELEIKALDGKAKIAIPKGTQSHTEFTLKGRGMPKLHSRDRGDLVVNVVVEIPVKITKKQEEALKEIEAEEKPTKKKRGRFW